MTPFCGGSLAWPHDGDESERQVARVLEGSERKAGFKADPAGLDPHPRSTSVGPTSLRGTVDDVLNACRRDSSRRLRFPHAPCRNANAHRQPIDDAARVPALHLCVELLLPATAFKIWALSELTTPMATQDASASATPNACSAENQILSSPA